MKYYIVNDIDRPCERLVAVELDGKLNYLDRSLRRYDSMGMGKATPMEDFGFTVTEKDSMVTFEMTSHSRATYPDGRIRQWQGNERMFTLPIFMGKDNILQRIIDANPDAPFPLKIFGDTIGFDARHLLYSTVTSVERGDVYLGEGDYLQEGDLSLEECDTDYFIDYPDDSASYNVNIPDDVEVNRA